ncbi:MULTISPECIES: hypothetical protein [Jonquetella]|uniref:Uncharacterized protein n=1 Tax=Jonquetella anthropi DSM 22815 TaxID=885272 RepID=H0UIL6_9BACT|nr:MULTISPECIES: hypothetical protein [Jonquetella]EEX49310.1 hypothetical protein GCWU000246_00042 [Jonquetella anthropi E3_33 E1]EHM13761.1 hypothetical protein JonanDRAFT_1397 [Jonquetella anthropi DSM 22815]ERL24231.1 hypothetical protein HMPREF1249_0250 [Jonquetella sp. BV3C21]
MSSVYGDRLEIDFYDPRCFAWLWQTIRFSIRAGQTTWVLNNKVIFRGVPTWDELSAVIGQALGEVPASREGEAS